MEGIDHPSTTISLESNHPETVLPTRLLHRIVWLTALFVIELTIVSVRLDTRALVGRGGFIEGIGNFGPRLLQSLIVFATTFLAFGYSKAKKVLPPVSERLSDAPMNWGYLAAHIAAMSGFWFLSATFFAGTAGRADTLIACAWIFTGTAGIATALFFFIPPRSLAEILRHTGSAWAYSVAAACATPLLVTAIGYLWKPAAALTFDLVKVILWPFVSTVADPVRRILSTRNFSVEIAPSCSGLEGMGLMLLFGALWLGFFHRDFRFPRALLFIPVGMVLMFLLNSVRIAALILIGNAGAASVAAGGFHSQAGWIAFNGLALGLACVAHRVSWISARPEPAGTGARIAENSTAAYLVPFLAILAASMISRAASGGFEWMYPLRFFAAVAALLLFRRQYLNINWRFGWAAPAIGGLVFLLWIAMDRLAGIPAQSGLAASLAAYPPSMRIAWIVFRALAAVVTVPIAEELAFRGFLLRRLISADFDSVGLQRWTLLAVAGSSIAFGLMHGDRWIAGTLAGFLYAGAQRWRGRIGDAVAAHSVTNALIAVWVLWGGHWSFW